MSDNNKKKDDFMGYATFDHVQNRKLRAFNRLTTFFRVFGRASKKTAQGYIQRLDKEGRQDVEDIYKDIKDRGISTIRLEIMEGKSYA